jgi:hypothetical protein
MEKEHEVRMRLKHFFRWFFLALGLQVFFVLGGYVLLVGPTSAKSFRGDVLLAFYNPFIHLVIVLGGYSGEAGMIWPPVYGVVLGILTYSIIFATIAGLISGRLIGR